MLYTVCIDESGTHNGAEAMMLGGFVGRLGHWQAFNKKWRKMLVKEGLTHHHSTDFINRKKQYQGWNFERGNSYIERAIHIAEKNTLLGFSVRLSHQDYETHYVGGRKSSHIQLDTKYGVCFRIILSYLPGMLQRSLNRSDLNIELILEDGGLGINDTKRLHGVFKKQVEPHQPGLVTSLRFADKKEIYGLQAADALAYAAYQLAERKTEPVMDFMPLGTLKEAKATTGMRSPILHLPVTPEVLIELKDNVIAQAALRDKAKTNAA